MHKLFMCKWVGNFNCMVNLLKPLLDQLRNLTLILITYFLASTTALAQPVSLLSETTADSSAAISSEKVTDSKWKEILKTQEQEKQIDRTNGLSYIISGGIALVGGLAGANITDDPLEKGVYSLFQTIGIASMGYGAFKWKVGDERRLMINSLAKDKNLNPEQKFSFYTTYYLEKSKIEKNDRAIRAITHGLIAALNFYNGSQQQQGGVKNTLYFIGGANLLAAISFTF